MASQSEELNYRIDYPPTAPEGPHVYLWSLWRTALQTWEPVYVGKSERDGLTRAREHESDALKGYSTDKSKKGLRWHRGLRNYLFRGEFLKVEIVFDAEDKAVINAEESRLIKLYGRREIDPGGTLWNLSDGGDGWSSDEMKQLHADPNSVFNSAEYRAKNAEANRALAKDPVWLAKNAERSKDPAYRDKMAAAGKKRAEDPVWRAKIAARSRDHEWKVRISTGISKSWQDEDVRQRRAKQNQPYYINNQLFKTANIGFIAEGWECNRSRITKRVAALNKLFIETGERPERTLIDDNGRAFVFQKADPEGDLSSMINFGANGSIERAKEYARKNGKLQNK